MKLIPNNSIFVQKSTVPVGTGEKIEKLFKKSKKKIRYVSNPEFLREGTAIYDSLWFDRIVVGGNDTNANISIISLYKKVEKNRSKIAKISGLKGPKNHNGEYFTGNRNSSELIKVTANAFLALKISFANSIAKLADKAGADVVEVMDAVGADKRIGRAFLNAGRGYGGGCFPKDVSGLISSAEMHGVELSIMNAATEVNDSMPGYIANQVKQALGSLDKKNISILGLSFKEGTSDARKSPGIKIANILSKNGASVRAYDPQANGEAKDDLRNDVIIDESLDSCIDGSQAIIITTAWDEFLNKSWKKQPNQKDKVLFVDAINGFDSKKITAKSFQYLGVGRG